MSSGGVHQNDMPTFPDDQWPPDDPGLAAFAEDLRIVAEGPAPEPRPGLVAVMRQGAVPMGSPAGRRKRMLAKTLVGGLVAKVAMGVGVAAASVTMAGAAGVLPEPAQDAVASVVAATTPFELPGPGVNLQVGDDASSSTSSSSTSTTVAGDEEEGARGRLGERTVNHGACVSAAAKHEPGTEGGEPNAHGKTVSSVARTDCGKDDKASKAGASTTTGASTTAGGSQGGEGSGPANRGNGNGNGANSGKGNPGKG